MQTEWKLNRAEAKKAYHDQIKLQYDEAKSVAAEKEEAVKAASVSEIARISKAKHILLDRRAAMTIKTDALAQVEQELQAAANRAKASSEEEGEATRGDIRDLTEHIHTLEARILEAKEEAAYENVNATEFADRSRTAKKEYQEMMQRESRLRSQISSSDKTMKEAQAKKVQAETVAKLAEVGAEGAVAMAAHDASEADEAHQLVENRTRDDLWRLRELEEDINGVVNETVDSARATYNASMYATLYGGEAKNVDELSDAKLRHAEEKEERADKLLKSVDALAAMAKTAAEIAQADNIRHHAEEVADESKSSSSPEEPVEVEVIAPPAPANEVDKDHKEVPMAKGSLHGLPIPGLGYLERDDPGTGKFLDAGIHV